jgi:hypothetical protein
MLVAGAQACANAASIITQEKLVRRTAGLLPVNVTQLIE